DLRVAGRNRDGKRPQRVNDKPRDQAMLHGVLGALVELARELLILGLGGAARDRARHRLRLRLVTVAPDEQLRRRAGESGAVGARHQIGETGWIRGANAAYKPRP